MAKFWQSVEVRKMTDIQRAMLGDHDAAARLTERGVAIPFLLEAFDGRND